MLLLAATKIRQMKMADPSMPTAQTRGSARWVFNRHHLVAPAPVITPRKPVKHVIAPKIKLLNKTKQKVGYFSKYLSPQMDMVYEHITRVNWLMENIGFASLR